MSQDRPPIPAEIRRRVLIDSGHRCSIPTCRQIICEVHHIIPWEQIREHTYENLICLCSNCHTFVHEGKIDRKSLKIYKHNLGLLHDKYTQFEIDLMFDLYKRPENSIYIADFMYYMVRRSIDSGLIQMIDKQKCFSSGDVHISFIFLVLTAEGRIFIDNLSKE